MTDQFAWLIILALALIIVGLFVLSRRLEKNLHETIEIMIRSNELIVAQLKHRSGEGNQSPEEPLVGMILDRRHIQRRGPGDGPGSELRHANRTLPGRRSEDFGPVAEV